MKGFIFELFHLLLDFCLHLPISCFRKLMASIFLNKCGSGTQFCRHVHLISPHRITIGRNSFVNRSVVLDGRMGILIGDNTDIGEYTAVWSLEHDTQSNSHSCMGGQTIIGSNCWIAPHCIILPNVKIGDNVVVATGSVVTKDIPDNVVVAGVPAKIIKPRNITEKYQLKYKIYL